MKTFVFMLLVALLSFASCLYFPWWSIAVVAFIIAALIPQKPLTTFSAAFVAVFLLWFGLSFYISMNNDHILARRISLIILKKESAWLLMVLTGLTGGIVAGLAALSASFLYPGKSEVYEAKTAETV